MGIHLGRIASLFTSPVTTSVSFMPVELTAEDRNAMDEYARVGRPLRCGNVTLKQSTPCTCGAMVVLASLVVTYPGLAETIAKHPETMRILEEDLYEDLRRDAVGKRSWPERFGTPPWTLAREMNDSVVEYIHRPVNDRSDNGWEILQWVYHATTQGHCVPLYTGNSLLSPHRYVGDRRGILDQLTGAVPRHVVLAVPGEHLTTDGIPQLNIFDPSSGKIYPVPLYALTDRSQPMRALGNWNKIVWAVLPRPTKRDPYAEDCGD
ncbi:MAG: hypothetical protein GX483_05230 [Actinomycetaceae bacterium]|nr:hypothetical protein [Actinomycetaceae bacterium]